MIIVPINPILFLLIGLKVLPNPSYIVCLHSTFVKLFIPSLSHTAPFVLDFFYLLNFIFKSIFINESWQILLFERWILNSISPLQIETAQIILTTNSILEKKQNTWNVRDCQTRQGQHHVFSTNSNHRIDRGSDTTY